MELTGWGKYPRINAEIIQPLNTKDVLKNISDDIRGTMIARGLGRSYGDSSLAPIVLRTAYLNHVLRFDEATGILTCSAGISLADILSIFASKGWFLPVTPGTQFVTVGGAVASDIHGKNHHLDGSFTDHVSSLQVATASDGIVQCSRDSHPQLFHATCGGMGLTGIILEATFKLKPIQSTYINKITIKTQNLEETLTLFEEHQSATYSVAWIDCLIHRQSLGKITTHVG